MDFATKYGWKSIPKFMNLWLKQFFNKMDFQIVLLFLSAPKSVTFEDTLWTIVWLLWFVPVLKIILLETTLLEKYSQILSFETAFKEKKG